VALPKAAGKAKHETVVTPNLLAENPPGTAVLGDSADGTGDPGRRSRRRRA
jgi:hypothetical protein